MGKIKVYKASAGAGKTYSLVYEYIKYLFLSALPIHKNKRVLKKQKSNVHRGVLAVTFTNKSTAEMKERIVVALDKLSKSQEEQYRLNLERDIWGVGVEENVARSEMDNAVCEIARELLIDILQDYSSFRVSTIDGFFQQIVRSFARELNLDNQYQVELDNETIMEMAVDNMLASLGDKNKNMLLSNLTEFASEKIEDLKSWNPRQDIIDLSDLVTSEEYMLQKENIEFDAEKLKQYRDKVNSIIDEFEGKIKNICEEAQTIFNGVANKEDVFAKTTLKGFDYEYLKNNKKFELTETFKKLGETCELKGWVKSKYKGDHSYDQVVEKLYPLATQLIEMCDVAENTFKEYQTAQIIHAHLYILGILDEINENAMEICRTKDCMILSSTTDFLNKIIDNSDTPFIYEKVGVSTDHFMIDEFQDTSILQWNNFIPLLSEANSRGEESMIVGDVKQSIYRWRNGDWKILHKGVETVFNKDVDVLHLDHNYRSAKEIIEFNNRLYGSADESYKSLPELLDEEIGNNNENKDTDNEKGKHIPIKFKEIYSSAEQKPNPKNKSVGYVDCRFFETDEDKEKTWKDKSLDALVEQIGKLGTHKGVAVLVRTNNEAQIIADRLKKEKIPFYSSEALCVADNPAVKLIEAVLRYVNQPYEPVYRANFAALYNQVCRQEKVTAKNHGLLSSKDSYPLWEKLLLKDETKTDEENEIRWKEFDNLRSYPLIRMIQTLDSLFKLSEIDDCYNKIYIQSFIDKVHEYTINNSADIRSFLDFWEENGEKTFISMPEGEDAVRIITIFKSKGLEFSVVFIPFVDWSMGVSKFFNIKLVNTKSKKGEIFDKKIPILPINTRSSKKLLNSEFSKEIMSEYLDSCLDKLNLFYVATTRAELQLYVYFKKEEPKEVEDKIEALSLSALVYQVLSSNKDIISNEENTEFEYGGKDGKFVQPEIKKETHDTDIENRDLVVNFENKASEEEIDARAQLSYKYDDEEEDEDYSARIKGIMMHKLFERIKNYSDIEKAVQSLVRDGDISEEEVGGLRDKVDRVMEIKGVKEWYSDKWHVLNEIEMYVNEGKDIYRPDRVVINEERKEAIVIDYKFGEKTINLHKKYTGQVRRYMNAIKEMGYEVKGYLLYAETETVDEI